MMKTKTLYLTVLKKMAPVRKVDYSTKPTIHCTRQKCENAYISCQPLNLVNG